VFREFLTGSHLLEWPLVALAIFFTTFVVAVVRVVIGMRGSPQVQELSRLPLDDSEIRREEV
jgi:hypothetical protein